MKIRPATLDDAAAAAAIYAPVVEHTKISFETEPPDAAEMRRACGRLRCQRRPNAFSALR